MKKYIFQFLLLFTILFIGSCVKEPSNNTPSQFNLSADETPSAVTDTLINVIENPTISDAGLLLDLVITSYPSIIESDYFVFAEMEGPQGGKLTSKDSSIKKCSDEFKITAEQKAQLNKAFIAKEECMKSQRDLVKSIDKKIEEWAKAEREAIMAKFKNAVNEINMAYQAGKITESQKKEMLSAAEKTRNESLAKLKMTAKEKLKASLERATASGKIQNCEKIYLETIKKILGEEKYAKWIKCHKWQYRKK